MSFRRVAIPEELGLSFLHWQHFPWSDMPTTISLRDFLMTGAFGGIRDDTHPDEVPGILGEPTHRYDEDNGLTFFLYGWYELAFMDGSAMYVQNDAMHIHRSDRAFRISWRDMVTSEFRDGRIAEEWVATDLAERLLLARIAN